MPDLMQLEEIEDAILRYVMAEVVTYEQVYKEFSSPAYPQEIIVDSLKYLEKVRNYIKRSEQKYLKPGAYAIDAINDDDFEYHCEITQLGKAFLARSTDKASFTSFSNISNSNISNQSNHTSQSISMESLSPDLKQKIADLSKAMEKKDTKSMKQAFGYIVDKSVDVAIALMTNSIVK